MLKHNIKLAFRNIFKHKLYSLINILGLAVGLVVSLFILLWVQDEKSVDQFHEHGDNVYQVFANMHSGNGEIKTWDNLPYPLADYLVENFPEIENVTLYTLAHKRNFKLREKEFLVDGIQATESFFDILSFPILEVTQTHFFEKSNSVLLSESLAKKLFGPNWKGLAVGKTLDINQQKNCFIAGVFADPPKNSSLQFDFVTNLNDRWSSNPPINDWTNFDFRALLLSKEGTSKELLADKMKTVLSDMNEDVKEDYFSIQSFPTTYLQSRYENGKVVGGLIDYVRIFLIAALFLLFIACINFMNLSTARASLRAKEVGVRKTIGANKGTLIQQFMMEALIITFISFAIALFLGKYLLPFFQQITNKEIVFNYTSLSFWSLVGGLGFTTAVLAGSYPAFFLSSFKIVNVLKGKLTVSFGGASFRKGLVVFQFILSILLIVSALVVTQQIDFLKNKNLGLEKDNVIYFRTPQKARKNIETFENEVLKISGITHLTKTSTNPLQVSTQTSSPKWEGMPIGKELLFRAISTDDNFLSTLKIPLVEGRNFSKELVSDTATYLLNETAVAAMGLENPIGKGLELWGNKGVVVGVVKDFHVQSLRYGMQPLIIANFPNYASLTMLRTTPDKTESVIASLETTFQKFSDGLPFRYDFLDERYWQMYQSEQRLSTLSYGFAFIALFVSCLGLLGLSAFIAEQKMKEIGIRKILGASIGNVVFSLSKNFLKLVGISLLIALPIAWYFLSTWLTEFAYRIDLNWKFFAAASLIVVAVAFVTVSLQALKAAIANPINAIKNE